MTNMIDIYEAGGATVNADRTQVQLSSNKPKKSFEIVLRVLMTSVEMSPGESDKVTFGVLLDDEFAVGVTTFHGTEMRHIYHDASITLPVDQVRILRHQNLTTAEELSKLPAGTVIMGPEWESEVYQFNGLVWYAPGSESPWSIDSLSTRGPFRVLQMGETK